jgi:hypothetical protein
LGCGARYRQGDNPVRWRGHLDHLLPEQGKVRRGARHAALPYSEGTAARALEFLILTAARGVTIVVWLRVTAK